MAKIITTSQLQKTIGQLLTYVTQSWVIVTKKGRPSAVILPYFDDNERSVAKYLEDYEMYNNANALQCQLRASAHSGISDFSI